MADTPRPRFEEMSAVKLALLARELRAANTAVRVLNTEPIAVIGMGCRFPGGANSPDALWRLLVGGVDAITEVPRDRWDVDAFYDADPATPGTINTRRGGFLTDIDRFDAAFFGIPAREAVRMDPQQRALLEVAWEALEDAGQAADSLSGSSAGVFVGVSTNQYGWMQFSEPAQIDAYAGTGNAYSIVANRLSYLLDLQGPSVAVDTACSSSLVAVHLACQSLKTGDCDLAIVGGVNVILAPELSITLSQARMLAPDGCCKVFDARADGYVRGEGCGVVVLKRLADALAGGDPIRAVIRGSAVNQDGRSNGLTAPSGPAQQRVIRRALAQAGIDPGRVAYVEAHGTGTALGDPIELEALAAVLDSPGRSARCRVGSIKANIGHLEAAAGIAGLIKTVLVVEHDETTPQLHLHEPNPHFAVAQSCLEIPTTRAAWPARSPGERRVAGVSAFGFGGTNAHVVIEDAPALPGSAAGGDGRVQILPVSARSAGALAALAASYADRLRSAPGSAAAFCLTASTRRSHHAGHRLAVVGRTPEALASALDRAATTAVITPSESVSVAFAFSGQAPPPAMVRNLIATEPAFRAAVERCAAALAVHHRGWSIEAWLEHSERDGGARSPLLAWTTEVALASLWREWGVEPAALLGIGFGEFAVAAVSGRLEVEAAARLVVDAAANRQRIESRDWTSALQDLPPGGPATVVLDFGGGSELARAVTAAWPAAAVLPSWRPDSDDRTPLIESLAALYARGQSVKWSAVVGGSGPVTALPPYPWQHQRYWMEARDASTLAARPADPVRERPLRVRVSMDASAASLQAYLRDLVAKTLETSPQDISLDQPLTILGIESITAMELKHAVQTDTGIELPVVQFLEGSTIADLAGSLSEQLSSAPAIAPASSAQRALWLLHVIDPDNAGYNVPIAGRLQGPLNERALLQSVRELVRRHAVLRTRFELRDRDLVQVIAPAGDVEMRAIDLRHLPPLARRAECDRLLLESARQPFELATGPVIRAVLYRCSQDDHVLLLNMHHIVSDAWSLEIAARELAVLYQAFSKNRMPGLPAPGQYADFVRMEQRRLTEPVIDAQLDYWRRQLRGAPPGVRLPAAHRADDGGTRQGERCSIALDRELTQFVESAARQFGATSFMMLVAALDILLFKWTGQSDIVIGSPFATRARAESRDLIGCLVNFIALRVPVQADDSGDDVVRRARAVVLGAMANQDCPFDRIVEALGAASIRGRNPIYNVALVAHNVEGWDRLATVSLDDSLTAHFSEVDTHSALLDLRFIVDTVADGTRVCCEYAAGLFDASAIDRLLRSYVAVIEQLVRAPALRISEFQIDETESTVALVSAIEDLSDEEVALMIAQATSESVE